MGFLDRLLGREPRQTYPPQASAPYGSQVPSPGRQSQAQAGYGADGPAADASPDERALCEASARQPQPA